jgi:hypothetical protein
MTLKTREIISINRIHRMVFLMVLWRCPVFSLLSFWQERYSNKGEFGVLAAQHLHEKTEALGENPVSGPLCSSPISHGLALHQNWASGITVHMHLHINTILIKRTIGQSLGIFRQSDDPFDTREQWKEKYFHVRFRSSKYSRVSFWTED